MIYIYASLPSTTAAFIKMSGGRIIKQQRGDLWNFQALLI